MSGKGDTYRPVDGETYRSEWDRIFRNAIADQVIEERVSTDDGDITVRCYTYLRVFPRPHLRHRPEPDTLPPHTQEGHGESDPAEND